MQYIYNFFAKLTMFWVWQTKLCKSPSQLFMSLLQCTGYCCEQPRSSASEWWGWLFSFTIKKNGFEISGIFIYSIALLLKCVSVKKNNNLVWYIRGQNKYKEHREKTLLWFHSDCILWFVHPSLGCTALWCTALQWTLTVWRHTLVRCKLLSM